MGIYSYEIYLTHMFVILLGASIFKKFELSADWLIPFLLLSILISYLLGKMIYTYFSEPVNNWLREKWLNKKRINNNGIQ